MKKTLLAVSVGLLALGGTFFTSLQPVAHAQSITIQQLVELFIQLGIIAPDKVAAAEAAVGLPITTTTTTSSIGTTTLTTTSPALTLSTDPTTPLTFVGTSTPVEGPIQSTTTSPITGSNAAPLFTLVGTGTITQSQSPLQNNHSTTTVAANFVVNIQAVGGNFIFPTQSSGSTFNFGIYQNGVETNLPVISSTSWLVPSSGVITQGLLSSQAFELPQNNVIQIPVTFTFMPISPIAAPINVAVGLDGINYENSSGATQTANYMSGGTAWRTPNISLTGTTQVNTQPSITVTSPNGGQALIDGTNYTINWSSTGLTSNDYIHIMLTDTSGNNLAYVTWWLPDTQTSYSWKVGTGIGGAGFSPSLDGGTYKVKVFTSTGTASALSGTFTVNAASPQTITTTNSAIVPTISIAQPNGSTAYSAGGTMNLSWISSGLTSPLTASLTSASNSYSIFLGLSTTTNSYSWAIPSTVVNGNYQVSFNSGSIHSLSNQFIVSSSITSNPVTPTSTPTPQTSTVTLNPNQDYYFHISTGSLNLSNLTSSGFASTTSAFVRQDELFFFANTPPGLTDSASAIYYLSSNGNWEEAGDDTSVSHNSDLLSTYFVIRTSSTLAGHTLTLPSNIIYDGVTAINGTPRPWPAQSTASTSPSAVYVGANEILQLLNILKK